MNLLKKYGWSSYLEPTPTNVKLFIDAMVVGLATLSTTDFGNPKYIIWINAALLIFGRFIKAKDPEIKQLPDEPKQD